MSFGFTIQDMRSARAFDDLGFSGGGGSSRGSFGGQSIGANGPSISAETGDGGEIAFGGGKLTRHLHLRDERERVRREAEAAAQNKGQANWVGLVPDLPIHIRPGKPLTLVFNGGQMEWKDYGGGGTTDLDLTGEAENNRLVIGLSGTVNGQPVNTTADITNDSTLSISGELADGNLVISLSGNIFGKAVSDTTRIPVETCSGGS